MFLIAVTLDFEILKLGSHTEFQLSHLVEAKHLVHHFLVKVTELSKKTLTNFFVGPREVGITNFYCDSR